jgi:phage terminase small subunit
MAGLTPKQERFVEEYLIDLNATQAAVRAGYSEKTAYAIGHENLRKPEIQEALTAARKRIAEKTGITPERVLEEYGRLAFLDIRKAFDEEGRLKPIHELDDDTAAAIAGLEVEHILKQSEATEELEGQPHGGALRRNRSGEVIGKLSKIKLSDKKGALDSLAKHLGMFVDRHEHTGKDGAPLSFTIKLDGGKA